VMATYVNTTQRFPLNTNMMIVWTHINGTDDRIYLNSKFSMRVTGANTPADANAFIGQFWDASLRCNGRLDNMLFYNVALTPDQINSIYRSANPRL